MIFASINFTESFSLFWIVLIASVGAFFVLVGVSMEVFWEKHWYKNISDFRFSESVKTWGGRFVVAGVVWEVVFGAGFAIKEEIDARTTKTNIAEIDWRKQPIYAFNCTATLIVRPLGPVEGFENLPKAPWQPPIPSGPGFPPYNPKLGISQTLLYFGRSWEMAKGLNGIQGMVQSDSVEASLYAVVKDNEPLLRFDIHFHANANDSFDSLNASNDFDAINLLVPIRCEIQWGEVKMSFDNDLTNRFFTIPPQKTFENSATSVATNGTFVPIDFSPKIRAEVAKSEDVERKKADDQAKFIARGIELEAKAHEVKSNDRTITDEQRDLFIKLLSEYPKTPIKVFVSAGDDEAGRYAQKIRELLDAAKYGGNSAGIITNSNIIMEGTNNEAWKPSSNRLAFLVYGNPRAPFFVMARSPIYGVSWAFSGIGLNGIYIPDNTILKPGEVGVVVPPKPK